MIEVAADYYDSPFGFLLAQTGETDESYLDCIPATFKFIASSTFQGDSDQVDLWIGDDSWWCTRQVRSLLWCGNGDPLPIKIRRKRELKITDPLTCSNGGTMLAMSMTRLRKSGGALSEECDKHIIADPPTMPTIVCKAHLLGNRGSLTFNWTYRVTSELPTRYDSYTFIGQSSATDEEETTWEVPISNSFIGGQIYIKVTAVLNGLTYFDESNGPYTIVGDNPSLERAQQGASREIRAIMYAEDPCCGNRQFETNPDKGVVGFTLWGNDGPGTEGGYGICQITKPRPSVEQLWNWLSNRIQGQIVFNDKLTLAQGYADRIRTDNRYWYSRDSTGRLIQHPQDPIGYANDLYQGAYEKVQDLSQDDILKDAFQRYNAGTQWVWIPSDFADLNSEGNWVESSPSGYGIRAFSYYSTHP